MAKKIISTRSLFSLLIAALALFFTLASGCTPVIGDECSSGRDCPMELGSVCDTTVEGGYCLIQDCDPGSCPADSACVEFDRNNRLCMALCESDSECRAGFECRKDFNLEGSSVGYCYTPAETSAAPAGTNADAAGDADAASNADAS